MCFLSGLRRAALSQQAEGSWVWRIWVMGSSEWTQERSCLSSRYRMWAQPCQEVQRLRERERMNIPKAFWFNSNIYLTNQSRAVQRCFPHVTADLIKQLYGSCKTEFSPSLLAMVCVVKPEGVPQLCKTDEIGEICVSSAATGTSYYGLTGMSKNTFEVWKYTIDCISTKFHC